MKKGKLGVVVLIIIVILGCGAVVLGSINRRSETAAVDNSSDESDGTVNDYHRAELVTIIQQYVEKHLSGVTVPDITDRSAWAYLYQPETGFYNVTTTEAKAADGSDYLITAWVELSGDTDYTIHYLHTSDGDLIDDGTVKD